MPIREHGGCQEGAPEEYFDPTRVPCCWHGRGTFYLPPLWLVSRRDSGPSRRPVTPHWGGGLKSTPPFTPVHPCPATREPSHAPWATHATPLVFFSTQLANPARLLTGTPPWGAGRASASPLVDLFVTLLTMGRRTFTRLIEDRAVRMSRPGPSPPPSRAQDEGGSQPPLSSPRDPLPPALWAGRSPMGWHRPVTGDFFFAFLSRF